MFPPLLFCCWFCVWFVSLANLLRVDLGNSRCNRSIFNSLAVSKGFASLAFFHLLLQLIMQAAAVRIYVIHFLMAHLWKGSHWPQRSPVSAGHQSFRHKMDFIFYSFDAYQGLRSGSFVISNYTRVLYLESSQPWTQLADYPSSEAAEAQQQLGSKRLTGWHILYFILRRD